MLAVLLVGVASAYVLYPCSWPSARATFYVKWDGGGTYDTAFIQAMNKWNSLSGFSFSSNTSEYVDPCNTPIPGFIGLDYKNGYSFGSTFCGSAWGATTLALTRIWYSESTMLDTDIIFNSNFSWGVHDGTTTSPYDFRRVAVHELGHALGLDHEPMNTAIMNLGYSRTIIDPQTDDINGLVALYGSLPLISLRAYNGQYLVAEGGGGEGVYANRDSIGAWEIFELTYLGNNTIALKAYNGQYLVAEGGGGEGVYANRDSIGAWETFELIDLGNNTIALRAYNGQYLVAEGGGGEMVYANRDLIGAWETFEKIE